MGMGEVGEGGVGRGGVSAWVRGELGGMRM